MRVLSGIILCSSEVVMKMIITGRNVKISPNAGVAQSDRAPDDSKDEGRSEV